MLVAAGLKAHGVAVEPVGSAGLFSAPGFQIAVVQFEAVLGVWLLWGIKPVGAWTVAVATFACFAGVSLYLGWEGQTSCGCFGSFSVNPWYALAVDLAALTALLIGRPDIRLLWERSRSDWSRLLWRGACGLAGVTAVLGLLAGAAFLHFGSVGAALAALRGEEVSVRPALVEAGEGAPGERLQASVELVNWTDRTIRIVGGTSDCSCVATADLPLSIPPGEARSVSVRVGLKGGPGRFTREVAFLTADEKLQVIRFRLTGRILGK